MVFALIPMERGTAEMRNDDLTANGLQRPGRWYKRGGPGCQGAAVLLILASLSATGFLMICLLRPPGTSSGGAANTEKTEKVRLPAHLFHGWPKDPDLVLVLTGERHGYV